MSQRSRKSRHSRFPSGAGGGGGSGGGASSASSSSRRAASHLAHGSAVQHYPLLLQQREKQHHHFHQHHQQTQRDTDVEESLPSQSQRHRREGPHGAPRPSSESSPPSLELQHSGDVGNAAAEPRQSLRASASPPFSVGAASASEAPAEAAALQGGAAASGTTAGSVPVHPTREPPPYYNSPAEVSNNWRARPTIQAVPRNAVAYDAAHYADSSARLTPSQATASKTTVMKHIAQTAEAANRPNPEKLLQKGAGHGKKMPLRTTKTSQKLVLFPDQVDNTPRQPYEISEEPVLELAEAAQTLEALPLSERPETGTHAERLSKDMRTGLPRVTAYCTAEGYRMADLQDYLQREHRVHTKLYDECLYVTYFFPLILGDGYKARLRSSEPPGHAKLHFRESDGVDCVRSSQMDLDSTGNASDDDQTAREIYEEDHMFSDYTAWSVVHGVDPEIAPGGEVFFFDYGVTVFWNLTEEEELDVLADIARFEEHKFPTDDIQVEEFHFQYDPRSKSSRVFNDMITLRTSNHMIKLTISHAISQSVTITLFEGRMENTIEYTRHIPKTLAETGEVNLSRSQVTKIVGHLFKLRIAVNLVSNVLDTPEIFWSEPSLQSLYTAVKGYLEIRQRAKLLNDRCAVISDLLDMLREHMSNSHMVYLNWIVIWLIVVAVLVGLGEIGVKYLSR